MENGFREPRSGRLHGDGSLKRQKRLSLSLVLGAVFPFVICPPLSIFPQALIKCLLW